MKNQITKKTTLSFFIALLINVNHAQSQGCIMVRNISGFGQYSQNCNAFTTSNWQLNIVGRYFKAWRDFIGTHDQKTPKQDQSIITSYSTDFTLSRLFNKGWSADFSFPIASNSRSATKEHGGGLAKVPETGTPRYTTRTFGIGDIRFTVYKWLLKPRVTQKLNVQLGLGIKLPTGDYKYGVYFHKTDSTQVLAPANASIQLGDGGTGIITQVNAFFIFNKSFSLYGNLYYVINPRDQNGVSTTAGGTPTAIQIKTGNDVYSVPDVYSVRGGITFTNKNLALSAGLRDEGVPVRDLTGGNSGLRRPGHNLSVEPGILYTLKNTSLYGYMPIIIARKIRQSLPDAETSEITHKETIGTGGSGNYTLFLGLLFKL